MFAPAGKSFGIPEKNIFLAPSAPTGKENITEQMAPTRQKWNSHVHSAPSTDLKKKKKVQTLISNPLELQSWLVGGEEPASERRRDRDCDTDLQPLGCAA